MNKPTSLRAALVAALPALGESPERLQVFIEQGKIAPAAESSLAFKYQYTCELLILDFTGHSDQIMVPLLAWARDNEPDLFRSDANQISFEAELLSNSVVDLIIKVPLTERVGVTENDTGIAEVRHLPERTQRDATGVPLREVWLRDEKIE